MAKGMKTFTLKVPNRELYRIVKRLDGKVGPHFTSSGVALVKYSPDELCEDVEDVRLVTLGTRDRVRTTHNFSPRADGRTDVMIELEVSLLKGGNMSVDINLALWTVTYMAIESAYLEGKGAEFVADPAASLISS